MARIPDKKTATLTTKEVAGNATTSTLSFKKLCLILAAICFLVYANTLQNDYALDDATVITQNSIVKKGFAGIPELLTTPRLKGFEQSNDKESYRPIPMVTHAIEYQLFESSPASGHLFNILFFTACVLALFQFLTKLFDERKNEVAFIACALFALHPIHTEVVANIKSRDELLCFLFGFLALNAFISHVQKGKLSQLLLGGFLLFLSFLSKETAAATVALIPFIFFLYFNEHKKRSLAVTLLSFAVFGLFMFIRVSVLGAGHVNQITALANPLLQAPDFATRIATSILVLGMYLKLLLIPYSLVSDYSYNTIPLTGFGNVYVIISLVIYLFLIGFAVYRLAKNKKDLWAFSIVLYLMSIALFSNIPFLIYSQMAERFTFMASAGYCVALALAFKLIVGRQEPESFAFLKTKKILMVLLPVCVLMGVLTIVRNSDWKDNYTLFQADAAKAPENCKLLFCQANTISQEAIANETNKENREQLDMKSIELLTRAIAINPDYSEAHAELGSIYDRRRNFDSAKVHALQAVRINPANAIATYNLGRAFYALKEYPEAIIYLKKTIGMQPGIAIVNLNLARCLLEYKQYDSAIIWFNKTLAIDPDLLMAKQGLQKAMQQKSVSDTTGKQMPN